MDARRAQRILLIAFAISLLLHLILALVARSSHVVEHVRSQVVSLDVRRHPVVIMHRIAVVAHTPPPSAKPIPTNAPAQRLPTKPISESGRETVASAAVPKPTATPAPIPAAACANPNAAAGVEVEPTPADIPLAVRAQNISGTATILVKLDEKGTVQSAFVVQSSGSSDLDAVATIDARNAQYAPAYKDCKPVPGEYRFRRKFVPF